MATRVMDYLYAARKGEAGVGKVNDKDTLSSATVLTDAGFLTAVPSGYRIVVPCAYMDLSTASDWMTVEFGSTANADGSGTFTAMTPKFRQTTGTAIIGISPQLTHFSIPLIARYADGAKGFTARVQCNDDAATVTVAFEYFLEKDGS